MVCNKMQKENPNQGEDLLRIFFFEIPDQILNNELKKKGGGI
jgi:hypothetical protein